MNNFEIGEQVEWTIGKHKRTGIVKNDNNDGTVDVICTSFAGSAMALKTTVQKQILARVV